MLHPIDIKNHLSKKRFRWLVTGVAGFIGSNLLEELLLLDQDVIGIDNFSTGHHSNLDDVKSSVSRTQWKNFQFYEGDLTDIEFCKISCKGVHHVLHQAALGSVPRSIKDPINTNAANINGFLNILEASKDASVKSFTYAASSSTYGDHKALPKIEENIGKPLSPYAITKYVNELYAEIFYSCYGFPSVGLRYFNVFGKRQDPQGAYAAVIPKWIKQMLSKSDVVIYGDGSTSRDFCYIKNAVQANLLAALNSNNTNAEIYNVAVGNRTTLLELFELIQSTLFDQNFIFDKDPIFKNFRQGDVKHSQASIQKISDNLNYDPIYDVLSGIREMIPWYVKSLNNKSPN